MHFGKKAKNLQIPFTLTYHPHNLTVKISILDNVKFRQNDPETHQIFSPVSFKRDKNRQLSRQNRTKIRQPTWNTRSRCKTCPFIQNANKILRPKRSVNICDRFTCISTNFTYCTACALWEKKSLWRNRKNTCRSLSRTSSTNGIAPAPPT